MKFDDYKEIITDKYGFKFLKNGIMIGTEEKPCLTCGCPTKYIDLCSESHFCSDECVKEFDKYVAVVTENGRDFEEKVNEISIEHKVTDEHAGCYLSNFVDDYCHKCIGGCKNINKCREIFDKEKNRKV